MPNLNSNTPYYGGTQVSNPANIINLSGSSAPGTHVAGLVPGTLAVNNATGTMYGLVSKSGGTGTWAVLGGGTADVNTLTPNSGTSPVVPVGGTISILGSGSTTTVGSTNTLTVQLTGLTNHNVLIGAGTATITKVAPSATSGVALVSAGAASDPAFGTVVVAGGGTGIATTTAYGLIAGGTTATGNFQNTGAGTAGQVLLSNGASALPAFGTLTVPGGGTGVATLTGVLTGNGASAITGNAVTNHGVLLGGASNAVSSLGVASTGTVLMGASGADPAFTATPSGLTSLAAGTLSATTTITAGTNITATLGDFVATNGGLQLQTVGNKISIKAGATGFCGTGTLSSGTVTINNTNIATGDLIFPSRIAANGSTTFGELSYTISNGASFTVTSLILGTPGSTQTADTSTFAYFIIRPL